MDKKSADEYDKMLDMADNLGHLFSQSSVELSDTVNEELSIYLAQHREEVLIALLAKKPAKPPTEKEVDATDLVDAKKASKSSVTAKVKKGKAKTDATKLSEAS